MNIRNFWAVGYNWGGNVSQLDRFIRDKIWEEGYLSGGDKRYESLINQIQIGDVLLAKTSSTKGSSHNITFTRLTAIGIIISKVSNSIFSVDWELLPNEIDFDWISYRQTIEMMRNDVMKDYAISVLNKIIETKKMEQYKKLLETNHNLILTGAPGTGKTYLAKQIAKEMGCSDDEIGFVQFHPSYDYTDFVEGLRPIQDDNGTVGFERKDGVFKEFCKKAMSITKSNFDEVYSKFIKDITENGLTLNTLIYKKDFKVKIIDDNLFAVPNTELGTLQFIEKEKILNHLKNNEDTSSYIPAIAEYIKTNYDIKIEDQQNINKNYVFIIDEINRGEISKIFGELFFSIDPGYRGVDENGKPKGLVKTQYQNLIDEDDEFYGGFFIPENVYIIGTMNDIDRSVESMDFAFRRRFAFKEIKADENVGMLDNLEASVKDKAINRMKNLNNAISQIDGLSSAYHIGGSYFLKLKNYDNDFEQLWDYHIEGLLREYLRGNPEIEKHISELKAAYNNEN